MGAIASRLALRRRDHGSAAGKDSTEHKLERAPLPRRRIPRIHPVGAPQKSYNYLELVTPCHIIGRYAMPNKNAPSLKHRLRRGFTLIEILVVIAIVAIVAVLAAPDMSALIKSNRIAGTINAMNADITFAKSEAIKRGSPVTLCSSSDQTACSSSSNLASGWIVFADPNENLVLDSDENIIKVQDKLKGNDSMVLSDSQAAISFNQDGFVSNLPSSGEQIINVKASDSDHRSQRCLSFQQMGQARIIKGGEQKCS